MLTNEIVLPVDTLNTGVTTNLSYTRFDEYNNRTVYISENHEAGSPDTLTFYRTLPKVSGSFKGVRKSAFKFSRAVTVPDTTGTDIDSAIIMEVSLSLPVGVLKPATLEMRQAVIALLDKDTVMEAFHDIQNI